jgi:hypothetical protein
LGPATVNDLAVARGLQSIGRMTFKLFQERSVLDGTYETIKSLGYDGAKLYKDLNTTRNVLLYNI